MSSSSSSESTVWEISNVTFTPRQPRGAAVAPSTAPVNIVDVNAPLEMLDVNTPLEIVDSPAYELVIPTIPLGNGEASSTSSSEELSVASRSTALPAYPPSAGPPAYSLPPVYTPFVAAPHAPLSNDGHADSDVAGPDPARGASTNAVDMGMLARLRRRDAGVHHQDVMEAVESWLEGVEEEKSDEEYGVLAR